MRKMIKPLISFLLLLTAISCYGQKFTKLALTPPMGGNSWNRFGCDINEKMVREAADTYKRMRKPVYLVTLPPNHLTT